MVNCANLSGNIEKPVTASSERRSIFFLGRDFIPFPKLFTAEEGRLGVVVTFLAIMELLKESLIDFVQNEAFGPIYVRAAGDATNGA